MLKPIQTFLVILVGFSVAYIDWEQFFALLVPKWENVRSTPQFIACLAVCFLLYYGLVYVPSGILVASIKKREQKALKKEQGVELKEISYR